MGLIPAAQIDLVRERADIVEIVAERLTLTQKGRQFWACCPFHQEKSPSFSVNPQRQIFKCFGCQKGGNVFGFIQEFERVSFPEAVRIVADRVGIRIDEDEGASRRDDRRRQLLELTDWACRQFEQQLWAETAEAQAVRDYLNRRGIREDTARRYRLGYAPPGWDGLMTAARRAGHSERDLAELGLVVDREGATRVYDRFRDRLMFPICDARGRPIAFGGRRLNEDPESPKYINSSEIPGLFEKRRVLYAIDKARAAHVDRLIVVEGYTDVILSEQAGVKGVVAVLGTAFSVDHVPLVSRMAKQVVLLFDGDAAGQAAAMRSLGALVAAPLDIRVATMKGAKDPADLVMSEGSEALTALIDEAAELLEFLLDHARAEAEESIEAKARVIERILTLLLPLSRDRIRADLHLRRCAERLAISEESLRDRYRILLEKASQQEARSHPERSAPPAPRSSPSEAPSPVHKAAERGGPQTTNLRRGRGGGNQAPREPGARQRSYPDSNARPEPARIEAPRPRRVEGFDSGAQLKILEALLVLPERALEVFSILRIPCFRAGPSRTLANEIQAFADRCEPFTVARLYDHFKSDPEVLALINELEGKISDGQERNKDYTSELSEQACTRVTVAYQRDQRRELMRLIALARHEGRDDDLQSLEAELEMLTSDLVQQRRPAAPS